MAHSFTLTDPLALADLHVFLTRAARLDDGVVRLASTGGVLAVSVGVLHPSGLLDRSPTILGLRTFALAAPAEIDAVVAVRALTDRIARVQSGGTDAGASVTVDLPVEARTAPWAAISPPRGGWARIGAADTRMLDRVARAGIDEVAAAVPTGTGEQIVQRVRSEVWGRPIDGLEHVPAGGAFAALSLGFLPPASPVPPAPGDEGANLAGPLHDLLAASATPAAEDGPAPARNSTGGPARTSDTDAPSQDEDEMADLFETGQWLRISTRRGHVIIKRRGGR